MPGRIDSKMSVGCNNLIKNGAKPVNSVDDILESFQFNLEKSSKIQLDLIPDLNKNEKLSHDPTHIDELVTQVNLNGQLVLSTLLQIEL